MLRRWTGAKLGSTWVNLLGAATATARSSLRHCVSTPQQLRELQLQASDLFQQGDFEGAIARWDSVRRALDAQQGASAGVATNDLVVVLNNLACAHGEAGRVAEKKNLLVQTLELVERQYGKDHVQYAITLYNLAAAYGDNGDHAKMKELLIESVAVYSKRFGPEHAKVARVLLLLADAHEALKEFDEQHAVMDRAVKIISRHCGPDHQQTALAFAAFGKAKGNLGDKIGKLRLLERALAIEEKRFGEGHPQLTMTMNNLALAHGEVGEFEMKKFFLEKAIEIQKRSQSAGVSGTHALLATTYSNYASVFGELGNLQKQLEWNKFALRYAMENLGSTHPQVPVALNNCASTYLSMGDTVGAEKIALSAKEQLSLCAASPTHPEMLRADAIIVEAHAVAAAKQRDSNDGSAKPPPS